MKVYNPTGFEIRGRSKGQDFVFKPDEVQEVYDLYDVNHLCMVNGQTRGAGLVALEYNKAEQEEFPNYDDYVAFKRVEGLNRLLETKKIALRNEQQAAREAKATKDATEGDFKTFNPRDREKEIKTIEEWVNQAGGLLVKKEEKEIMTPQWLQDKIEKEKVEKELELEKAKKDLKEAEKEADKASKGQSKSQKEGK